MDDQIYITIAKVLDSEANDADRQALEAWFRADAGNERIFAEMKAAWSEADVLLNSLPDFDVAPAWQKVSARMKPVDVPDILPAKRTISLRTWGKYSAAVAALLIIALLIFNPFGQDTIRLTATDENRVIELPDHSTITLRRGSTISYPKKFAASERRVSLQGEAFFDVAHNEQQPFIVDAQSVSVQVLGTTFNVLSGEQSADVTVATGRVRMTARSGDNVILTPGSTGHLGGGQLTKTASRGTELAWMNGELSFNNEPLSKIVTTIAAAKNADIRFDADLPPSLQSQAVTISFRNQSVEDMLTEICLITSTRWEKSGATYLIRKK